MFPRIVFSDFDGTLTHGSSLGSFFFDTLEVIASHRSELVIVTGRPATWGHFLISHTNVSAVISEGGGILTRRDEHGAPEDCLLVASEQVARLEEVTTKLREAFPELKLTTDSLGRRTDRAIELRDVKPIEKQLTQFLKAQGVNFSCSNVHLNFWCGDIEKYSAILKYLEMRPDGEDIWLGDCIFFGDSLNDQSVFKNMAQTVGVANIEEIMDRLEHKPRVILRGERNVGPYGVLNYLLHLAKK